MSHRGNSIIITNKEGEYLMQFRDDNPGIARPLMWDFFGGAVEDGETDISSARRELEEELMIRTTEDILELLGEYPDGPHTDAVIRYKKTVGWEDFVVLEGAGCGFFTKTELMKLPMAPRARGIVERYM